MNYFNPYYMINPVSMVSPTRSGLGLFARNGFNLGTLLNGAQRTLGLVNQTIPLIKQAAPMVRNAKTMFRVMNEFKKVDAPSPSNANINTEPANNNSYDMVSEDNNYSNEGPTFFI